MASSDVLSPVSAAAEPSVPLPSVVTATTNHISTFVGFNLPSLSAANSGRGLHEGSWDACGGNPDGEAHPTVDHPAECSADCRYCGAGTHWSCCSTTQRDSSFCSHGV